MLGIPLSGYELANAAMFIAGLAILGFVVVRFRNFAGRGQSTSYSDRSILSMLIAQQFFGHVLLVILFTANPREIHITAGELVILLLTASAGALVTLWMSNVKRDRMIRAAAGAWVVSVCTAQGVLTLMMAYPVKPTTIDMTFLLATVLPICAFYAIFHSRLIYKNQSRLTLLGIPLVGLAFPAIQLSLAHGIQFDVTQYEMLSDVGLDARRLQCFLAISTVIAVSLTFVTGSDPRQHWRRYAVAAFLTALLSISVFQATDYSTRRSTTYFELARLTETLNAQRSELFVQAQEYQARDLTEMSSWKVPSTVFEQIQSFYENKTRVEELIASPSTADGVREFYYSNFATHNGEDSGISLAEEMDHFYQFLKSSFGLQSQISDFTKVEELLFGSRLSELSRRVLVHAKETNDLQLLVRDMSLVGGIFIFGFMVFGVFLPAQRSTVGALDELEAEKARVYKLALCAEHTTKGIVLTDWRRRVTWCNDAFSQMSGFAPHELEGVRLEDVINHPDADEDVIRSVSENLRDNRTADYEILAMRKNGQDFWLSGAVSPVFTDRRVRQFVHVIEDVTEDRAIRQRLASARAESDRLALIARHASDGMAILDTNYSVAWVNPSMEKMTGYSLAEMCDVPLNIILSGPDTNREKLDRSVRAVTSHVPVNEELLIYPKSGDPYWVDAIHTPIFESDGTYAGCVIVHRNITERKNLELELIASRDELAARVEERTQTIMNQSLELEKALASERELNRMQAEFVSMASHEFRTPLTIIDGAARRIEKRADRLAPDEIRERVGTIRATVKRMTMLVERTLDATRLSSGRIRLSPEPFSLKDLVNEVCTRQKEVATTYTINVDIDELPTNMFGDAKLLDNVVTNIISNAVKYSGKRKYVSVKGFVEDQYATLKVRDTGIGIPKEEISKIFQRFFRASTSTGIPGTGIGLNLVKSLVEMHYGDVEIDSVEGEWTELTLKLPLKSPLDTAPGDTAPDTHRTFETNEDVA